MSIELQLVPESEKEQLALMVDDYLQTHCASEGPVTVVELNAADGVRYQSNFFVPEL